MRYLLNYFLGALLLLSCSPSKNTFTIERDNKAFEKLRKDLGAAFINGDHMTVASYHHPDVVKALAYDKLIFGRDAVINEFKTVSQYYRLAFKEHKIESFLIHGNTATEISSFTIEGIPKGDSNPFLFKGRSMVVYVRYEPSPAGWALIRETVQPAP
jgi:ketosteroid isomerase-like protein